MKSANAIELDRKSGVRLGERGAPVDSLDTAMTLTAAGLDSRWILTSTQALRP